MIFYSASIGLNQVSIARWTSYLSDIIHELESSSAALESDKYLAYCARVARVANDFQEMRTEFFITVTTSHGDGSSPYLRRLAELGNSTKHFTSCKF